MTADTLPSRQIASRYYSQWANETLQGPFHVIMNGFNESRGHRQMIVDFIGSAIGWLLAKSTSALLQEVGCPAGATARKHLPNPYLITLPLVETAFSPRPATHRACYQMYLSSSMRFLFIPMMLTLGSRSLPNIIV